MEPLHRRDSRLERPALIGVVDSVVVQGEAWVVSGLDCVRYLVHEQIEVVGALYQAYREHEIGSRIVGTLYKLYGGREISVLTVNGLDGYVVPGEHVASAKSKLKRVAQVYRDGDRCVVPGLDGCLNG